LADTWFLKEYVTIIFNFPQVLLPLEIQEYLIEIVAVNSAVDMIIIAAAQVIEPSNNFLCFWWQSYQL